MHLLMRYVTLFIVLEVSLDVCHLAHDGQIRLCGDFVLRVPAGINYVAIFPQLLCVTSFVNSASYDFQIALALLLGSDYSHGVRGFGPVSFRYLYFLATVGSLYGCCETTIIMHLYS